MNLLVIRNGFTNTSTEGELYVDGKLECYTLEDTVRPVGVKIYGETAIPCGRYRVTWYYSPHFKKWLPLLLNVPGFSYVEIHSGNKPADTKACILVGDDRTTLTDAWIGQSKKAESRLVTQIKAALDRHEEVWITISEDRKQVAA